MDARLSSSNLQSSSPPSYIRRSFRVSAVNTDLTDHTELSKSAERLHFTHSRALIASWKAVPETQSLVSRASDAHSAIWTHGQVENSVCVACERNNLRHAWVLPDHDLVLRVAVR